MNLSEIPHRRQNPLTGEWILVSPHRAKRPWQGQTETAGFNPGPQYDPNCYLCPGNTRAGGIKNPQYDQTFVFENDFAALLPNPHRDDSQTTSHSDHSEFFNAKAERGICRVICFSPRHDLTFALMQSDQIEKVVTVWKEQYLDLGAKDFISHVQIFENRGAVMGCSNPHPHGQIWANESIPTIAANEDNHQKKYYNAHGKQLLLDYLKAELKEKTRIIFSNDHVSVLVPFWAVWPFEVLVIPHQAATSLTELSAEASAAFADALRRIAIRYDNLFNTSFPYSFGLHQAPTISEPQPWWQLHAHYYPPLLRSASVKKFMVGYEMLCMSQRDITPEESARRLREDVDEIHFSK